MTHRKYGYLLVAVVATLAFAAPAGSAAGSGPASHPKVGDDARLAALPGRIVMSSRGDGPAGIFSMLPDGTDVRPLVHLSVNAVVTGLDAADDGSQVATSYALDRRSHIYVVRSDGTGFTQVTRGGYDTHPSFSPDGLSLVFSRYGKTPSGKYRNDLYRVNIDGTGLQRLTSAGEPQAVNPSWSPGGKTIAFVERRDRRDSLILTNLAGTWFRFVRTLPRSRGYLVQPDWSPDSSALIYSQTDRKETQADLWTIHRDGTARTRITNTPRLKEESPSYSPDGSAIACSLQDDDLRWTDVMVMNSNGTGRHRIKSPDWQFDVSWGG